MLVPKNRNFSVSNNEQGFSLVELIMVLVIIMILTATTFYYLSNSQSLYDSHEQALKISDVFQEARQRSLTQRETMRVEIDMTENIVRLIDENDPETVSDDRLMRTLPLLEPQKVRVDQRPAGISLNPPEEFPVPSAQFRQSIYPESLTHNVCTLRFMSNGTVVDQGTNEVGRDAISVGSTLHVWSPKDADSDDYNVAHSITVIGSTGSIRLWEYDAKLTETNKWKDTRRTSIFGGQGQGGGTQGSGTTE